MRYNDRINDAILRILLQEGSVQSVELTKKIKNLMKLKKNLSYDVFTRHVVDLEKEGMLVRTNEKRRGRVFYSLTDKAQLEAHLDIIGSAEQLKNRKLYSIILFVLAVPKYFPEGPQESQGFTPEEIWKEISDVNSVIPEEYRVFTKDDIERRVVIMRIKGILRLNSEMRYEVTNSALGEFADYVLNLFATKYHVVHELQWKKLHRISKDQEDWLRKLFKKTLSENSRTHEPLNEEEIRKVMRQIKNGNEVIEAYSQEIAKRREELIKLYPVDIFDPFLESIS